MIISRRNLLRTLSAGAMNGAACRVLSSFASAQGIPAPRADSRSGPIVLSRNENAYGPSEKVLAAIREASSSSNRYPRTEYDSLLGRIAALHHVRPERIVLGCGSSEILRMAASAFLGPRKRLVQASPTCPLLGEFAQNAGAEVINIPLNKMYEHDLDRMLAGSDAATAMVYICNPNNPTGTLTSRRDIEIFIRKLPATTMVVIDEAYHHYVTENSAYASFLDRPFDDPRVVIVRTFSKIYGLAGMRIGYGVAAPDIALRLTTGRLRSGIGVISARAAAAALEEPEYVLLAVRRNANDRQEFMNQVNARMLRALDSHTNFVMVDAMRPTDKVFEHLKTENIFVAPPVSAMNKYIRVSLGTPAEMLRFWRAWDLMPPRSGAM